MNRTRLLGSMEHQHREIVRVHTLLELIDRHIGQFLGDVPRLGSKPAVSRCHEDSEGTRTKVEPSLLRRVPRARAARPAPWHFRWQRRNCKVAARAVSARRCQGMPRPQDSNFANGRSVPPLPAHRMPGRRINVFHSPVVNRCSSATETGASTARQSLSSNALVGSAVAVARRQSTERVPDPGVRIF